MNWKTFTLHEGYEKGDKANKQTMFQNKTSELRDRCLKGRKMGN